MGFFFHQLSVRYNLILDLAIRNGNFFKAHGKFNNEKEIFLVLYLAQDSSDSKMGGACLVSGGGHPLLQSSLGLLPSLKVRGLFLGTQGHTQDLWARWAHWQKPAKEAAMCQCYFRQASLAGAVILSLS